MPKFEEHTELLECGDCPFLKIDLKGSEYFRGGACGQRDEQENTCQVDEHYFGVPDKYGDTSCEFMDYGENPKRKGGCLLLAKHIHKQMVDAWCDKGRQ